MAEYAPDSNVPLMGSESITQMFQAMRGNARRSERVGYYRRPRDWSSPLWIVTDQTQPLLRVEKITQGFEMLPQYGFTPPPERDDPRSGTKAAMHYGCAADNSRELWTPILSHPQGPSEFPAEQVMLFRWYRPEGLPGIMKGRQIRFSQFEAFAKARGGVKEYRCPDCNDITFFRPSHLARHLHNSHGYDQAAIIALGTASGIDFNEGLMSLVESLAVWEVPEDYGEQEMSFTPPPVDSGVVVVERLTMPNREQVRRAEEQVQSVHEDATLMAMIADLQQQIEDLKAGMVETVDATVKPVRAKPPTEAQLAHLERMRTARAAKRESSAEEGAETTDEELELEPALA